MAIVSSTVVTCVLGNRSQLYTLFHIVKFIVNIKIVKLTKYPEMWSLHAGRQDKGFDVQLLTEHVHCPVQERDDVTGDGSHSSKDWREKKSGVSLPYSSTDGISI